MKTDRLIEIPDHGTLAADDMISVRNLIKRCDRQFRLSAEAWEEGNNSGDCRKLEICEARSRGLARKGAQFLAPLGIKCDWPGLYPSFQVNGFHEYTTEAAVLAALGHPRNWLRDGKAAS